jgi:hypothetical protein
MADKFTAIKRNGGYNDGGFFKNPPNFNKPCSCYRLPGNFFSTKLLMIWKISTNDVENSTIK